MPIYEMECENCEEHIDIMQKHDEELPVICNSCGHPSLKKVLTTSYFRMSGGGVYAPSKSDGKGV